MKLFFFRFLVFIFYIGGGFIVPVGMVGVVVRALVFRQCDLWSIPRLDATFSLGLQTNHDFTNKSMVAHSLHSYSRRTT